MNGNPLQAGSNNSQIEKDLEELPDKVADALEKWKITTLDRQRSEAMIYIRLKGDGTKRTTDEIKAHISVSPDAYNMNLLEIQAEAEYIRLYERLMSAKKLSGLRTAY